MISVVCLIGGAACVQSPEPEPEPEPAPISEIAAELAVHDEDQCKRGAIDAAADPTSAPSLTSGGETAALRCCEACGDSDSCWQWCIFCRR